jgi:hypothetical protein
MTKLFRELNHKIVQETEIIKKTVELFEQITEGNTTLQESLIDLRADVRRHLINNQKVSTRFATTLAQIFVISEELEKELLKSTKYKDSVLKKKMEKIFQVASELATKDDSTHPKLVDSIRHVLDKLEGNPERIETITKTFERIILRLESSDAAIKIKAMKMASLIMQSNDNIKKRREVIDQL